MGLEDISRITGLQISGWSVIINAKGLNIKNLCIKCLGTDNYLIKTKSEIKLSWFKSNFEHWDDLDLEGAELDRYVRVVVLYIIGFVILPSTPNVVSLVFLTFLKNVDEIRQYA